MGAKRRKNMVNKDISRSILKLSMIIIMSLSLLSCLEDDMDDCGVYLEFIYDYNMEYSDSFDPLIGTVDVFVFDADGKYLFTKQSRCEDLDGNKRMFLGSDLPFGSYKILTVGGLSDKFSLKDRDGNEFSPGATTLEDVRISLERASGEVSHEFPHLWVGSTIPIEYRADLSVWPVHFVRNTNKFELILSKTGNEEEERAESTVPYTFEIRTPEGAVYGHDNSPLSEETVTYKPYRLVPGTEPGEAALGFLNTLRLFYGEEYAYRILIRNTQTQDVVWEYDLMELLEHRKPGTRPDGTPLPMQEYLDRESEWRLKLNYREDESQSFIAVSIEINKWIIWFHDVEA